VGCGHSPTRLGNRCASDVFGFQRIDHRKQIVTHQIQDRAQQIVVCLSLHEISIGRVHRQFRRWKREYQPAVAKIDRTKPQNVAKERTVGFRVFAVQHEVRAPNHAATLASIRALENPELRPRFR
jgi:ribosomal protein L34